MSNPYDPYNSSGDQQGGDPNNPVNQGNQPPPPPPYGGASYPAEPGAQTPPPYGQTPPPYGQTPYGQTPFTPEPAKKTDAVSITGFVLAFTCFLSPVGLILGLVGLGRTKGGQRKGRWAAISAIPLGLVFSIIGGLIVFGVVYALQNVITPDNAEVGQCIEVSRDGDEYNLLKQDCTDTHDAEVIYVGVASDYEGNLSGSIDPVDVCTSLMPDDDLAALAAFPDDLIVNLIIEDPSDISPDDKFLCFAELSIGSLDKPIL
ncbi:hypothetical protein BH09ACT12_BH09ACT12_12210 [soil metagenome]